MLNETQKAKIKQYTDSEIERTYPTVLTDSSYEEKFQKLKLKEKAVIIASVSNVIQDALKKTTNTVCDRMS